MAKYQDVIIAGFGGQGVLMMGYVYAHAAMSEGCMSALNGGITEKTCTQNESPALIATIEPKNDAIAMRFSGVTTFCRSSWRDTRAAPAPCSGHGVPA